MDSLHKGLALAGAVLLMGLIGVYLHLARHGVDEFISVSARSSRQWETTKALETQVGLLEADPTADAERLDDLRWHLKDERTLNDRLMGRLLNTLDWAEFIADLRWPVIVSGVLSFAITCIGWSRWMKARRRLLP